MDNLISLTEAVALTGRTRITIMRWVDKGEVEGKKVGNAYVIDKESLLNYNKQRT